ncbi:MAG: relaxase domain-containing protein [Xanthobacteraceae bacterium]|nr:relaxase domain-containing protein [Xanthobacteraceae bacterium]
MVASFALIRRPSYYTRGQAADYYQTSTEAGGVWLRGNARLGVEQGTPVDAKQFERLCAGRGPDGTVLVKGTGAKGRVAGVDVTLSSPKAVSVLWAIGNEELRAEIAAAEAEAVEATLQLIEREIPLARRGRHGARREHAAFVAAVFTHGETRPELHADGTVMPSPQRHHHVCLPSIVERQDGSWGAIDSVWVRSWKKTLGAQYRLALASALQERGLAIDLADNDWRWSLGCVPEEVCRFFSARRASIEEDLESAGVTSRAAPALAAAITLRSRRQKAAGNDLTGQWRQAVEWLGYQPETIVEAACEAGRKANRELTAKRQKELVEKRLEAVPPVLVEHQSTFARRHLLEAIANALVGTKVAPDRVYQAATAFLAAGAIRVLGETRDGPVLSTPEMIAIERDLVATASRLATERVASPAHHAVRTLARQEGLSAEQTEVVRAATSGARLVAVQGIAGSGKSTALRVISRAWESAGYQVVAASVAWRAANALKSDLAVEARAIDSWLARAEAGQPVFNNRTVLLVDEAALQSSPQTHRLLKQIRASGAVAVLVGDESQLRPIGPGHAMRLVREAIGAVALETIVRQRAAWAREMVHAFARGHAKVGLDALTTRGLLTLHDGPKAAIQALVAAWEQKTGAKPTASVALIAKTNAEVRAINAAVRQRLKDSGIVHGREVALPAVDASGNKFNLRLACGDRIRFLQRDDRLDVINGSEATIEKLTRHRGVVRITAQRAGQRIVFSANEIADAKGSARLAHAYAMSLFQAQGITTETALVLASPQFDRHSAYVAASRARSETRFFADTRQIDAHLAETGLSAGDVGRGRARLDYLAKQFARESIKTTTLDAFNLLAADEHGRQSERIRRRELDHELSI